MVNDVNKHPDSEDWVTPKESSSGKNSSTHLCTNQNDAEKEKKATKSSTKSFIHSALKCCCCSLFVVFVVVVLSLVSLFNNMSFSFVSDNNDNYYTSTDDDGFDILDLFGMREQIQEIPLDLSLSQIHSGYSINYPLSVNRQCPDCGGQGYHTHSCPHCGGSGIIRTSRGMAYCNYCRGQGYIASDMCSTCHGSGMIEKEFAVEVHVPAGVPDGWNHVYKLSDGSKVRFRVHQLPDSTFERKGDDLIMIRHISLKEALLGTSFKVHTINNEEIDVRIPSCSVQPFEEIKQEGQGLMRYNDHKMNALSQLWKGKRGDLIIIINIDFPYVLTEKQKDKVNSIL